MMKHLCTFSMPATLALATPTQAGNTSLNSSNGGDTQVDAVLTEDGQERSVFERRASHQRGRQDYRSERRSQCVKDDD